MIDDYCEYNSDSSSDDFDSDDFEFNAEEWQDWNSEELLNLWMSVVEYHETWYLPLNRTFNQFCEFVYSEESFVQNHDFGQNESFVVPEIQAIKGHPLVKDLDWDYFFSLSYK